MTNYLLSFLFIAVAELLLTIYSISAANKNASKAALFAALNTLLYQLNIENIIKDKTCILFAAAGAFVGTFVAVKMDKTQSK